MASTRTESKPKTPPPSDEEAIVELQAPAAFGFSGTVKKYRLADAAAIDLLRAHGYTVVESAG